MAAYAAQEPVIEALELEDHGNMRGVRNPHLAKRIPHPVIAVCQPAVLALNRVNPSPPKRREYDSRLWVACRGKSKPLEVNVDELVPVGFRHVTQAHIEARFLKAENNSEADRASLPLPQGNSVREFFFGVTHGARPRQPGLYCRLVAPMLGGIYQTIRRGVSRFGVNGGRTHAVSTNGRHFFVQRHGNAALGKMTMGHGDLHSFGQTALRRIKIRLDTGML
jgi:hypothetical protein